MKAKTVLIIFSGIFCMALSACDSDIEWFSKKQEGLVTVESSELESELYYTKQGTRFYPTYTEYGGTARGQSYMDDAKRVVAVCNNDDMIPAAYLADGIAYSTENQLVDTVNLERFKDLGYSFGVAGATFGEDGYFTFTPNDLIEGSELATLLEDENSREFRFATVNDINVTQEMANIPGGCIVGMEKDGLYKVQIFAGTHFVEGEIHADTHLFQSFESFSFDHNYLDFASHGYLYFSMPQDFKSGYYLVNGVGFFKYYEHKKGESGTDDMNISYYASEHDKIVAQSRQFTVNIPARVKDLAIKVPYYSMYEDTAKGYVFSPDGIEYEMSKNDDGYLILTMKEATAGEWTVSIMPKNIELGEIETSSTKAAEEATCASKEFAFENDEENVVFKVNVQSNSEEDEVYGYVIDTEGRTYTLNYEFDNTKKEGKAYYELAHVNKGIWTMKVYYHPTTTTLGELETASNYETETDIIVIGD